MQEIIEAISKLLPFSSFFEHRGLNKESGASLSVIIVALMVYLFTRLYKLIAKKIRVRNKALQSLQPQFDYLSIEKAKRYYIATQYQNASPARQDEPGFTHKYIARSELIPFFINTAFNEKKEADRFYLVLADSGMGKTTFMINLYLQYHSFFNRQRKYNMKLFRFSHPDTISQVKAIEDSQVRDTILLLDALDEDAGILSKTPGVSDEEAFRKRVDELIEITRNFREVIITCRTQYFPGQEDDPYELKLKRPDERGFYTLNKLYISPFTNKEVKEYLNKKYGFISINNHDKKEKAFKIASQSIHLVMRPMLLSYIDYLVDGDVHWNKLSVIYDVLVYKWLGREAEKRKIIEEREEFAKNLYRLSVNIAVEMYSTWRQEGRMYLTKEETYAIADKYRIYLKPDEITGQSLLTYDGSGNWKFAHKSIFEFFIAREARANPAFLQLLNFNGLDMAQKFYDELFSPFVLIDAGTEEQMEDLFVEKASRYYLYRAPVMAFDFNEVIVNRSSQIYNRYKRLHSGDVECALIEAMLFCNLCNQKNGYPIVYDDNRHLLDKNGTRTDDIREVHGFRLPTIEEWEQALSEELILASESDSAFNPKDIFIENRWSTERNNLSFNGFVNKRGVFFEKEYSEWCFDTRGPAIATVKMQLKKPANDFRPYKAYVEEKNINRAIQTDIAMFRLVFVP